MRLAAGATKDNGHPIDTSIMIDFLDEEPVEDRGPPSRR